MVGHTSKVGQRADRVMASDEPHDRYTADGRPVLLSTEKGNVVEKSVTAYTVTCDYCGEPCRYDDMKQAVCEDCGFIAGGKDSTPPLYRDAKAAGRIDTEPNP